MRLVACEMHGMSGSMDEVGRTTAKKKNYP
jgi:hypothetical protein